MKEKTDLLLICTCGCKYQFGIDNFGGGSAAFSIRKNGRHRWQGVVLEKDEVKKIIEFLFDCLKGGE